MTIYDIIQYKQNTHTNFKVTWHSKKIFFEVHLGDTLMDLIN